MMRAPRPSHPLTTHRTRKAQAYRLHIIESALPAHIVGSVLGFVNPVVNKMRHPDEMVLFASLPWCDFREWLAFCSFSSLGLTQHALVWYIAHFERFCDAISWLGLLPRCTMNLYCPELPSDFFRVFTIIVGAVAMRYELRKQWKHHLLRLTSAAIIDAHVKRQLDHGFASTHSLLAASGAQIPAFLVHITLCLSIQAWLEKIDGKTFDASWARSHWRRRSPRLSSREE